jgi:hypothetical protein
LRQDTKYCKQRLPEGLSSPHRELHNVRSGFFEEADLRALLTELPEPLRPLIEFLYLTGWRSGEALGLTSPVDFDAGMLRLELHWPGRPETRSANLPCSWGNDVYGPRARELHEQSRTGSAAGYCRATVRAGSLAQWRTATSRIALPFAGYGLGTVSRMRFGPVSVFSCRFSAR